MSDTQYAEDLFPENEQFADDLFPDSVDTERARKAIGSSPIQDHIFSRDNVSVARVLNHFGQGFKHGWGEDGMTVTKEAADYMRKSGWFGDYEDGQASLTKAANEALFRPAAIALFGTVEGGFRLMSGAFRGVQEVVAGTAADLGQPRLGRELAAIPEAFMHARPVSGMLGMPQMRTGVVGRETLTHRPGQMVESGEALLLRARAANIIGPGGEAAWRGVTPVEPAPRAAEMPPEGTSAIERTFADAVPEGQSAIEQTFAAATDKAPDVHSTARGIAPDLFYKYDELQARRDKLSSDAAELSEMRARDAAQAQEIETLKAKVQEQLRATENDAREMAPAVREAYSEAHKATAEEPVASVLPDEPISEVVAKAQEDFARERGATHATVERARAIEQNLGAEEAAKYTTEIDRLVNESVARRQADKAQRPIEAQRAYIQNDITEKLVAAGRPQAEAQTAAAIDAAYWETRAARFEGKKGTAEEMYRREAPEILGPGMQSDFQTPRAKPKRESLTLTQFIAQKGGIKDNDPLIGDIRSSIGKNNKLVPGFGALIRKNGIGLDRLREAAAEAGYIKRDTDINALLNALDSDLAGKPIHAMGEEVIPPVHRGDHLHAIETALDDALREVGLDPSNVPAEVHSRAIAIMDKEGVRDPIAAYEKAEAESGLFQRDSVRYDDLKTRGFDVETPLYHQTAKANVQSILKDGFDISTAKARARLSDEQVPNGVFLKPTKSDIRVGATGDDATQMPVFIRRGKERVFRDRRDIAAFLENDEKYSNLAGEVKVFDREKAAEFKAKFEDGPRRGRGFFNEDAEGQADAFLKDWSEGNNQRATAARERATEIFKEHGIDTVVIKRDEGFLGRSTETIIALSGDQLADAIPASWGKDSGAILFQDAGAKIKRGYITLRENGRNTIRLLKDANASTFIHEKGHDYLLRMIRDAADPDAPAVLKTDADTVLKWLGVDKAADIKTRHHEKYARGFENYVMEGRAPSQGLARVFEQFRQWLVRIYTDASRLKAPINDDIRAVFDRMLSVDPEKVVIAPDRVGDAAVSRLEAAGEATPAPAAADLAGAVQAERDRMAAALPAGKQNARLAEIRAEIEGRASGNAKPDGNGNGPVVAPEGRGAGGEPSTAGAAGSEAAPQASGVAETRAPGPSVKTERPTSPNERFAPDTGTDKAGNIRLDLLKAPDDVKDIISQVADENAQFQSVRGPVTDVQVAELADAMGIDAQYLSTRKMGEAWTAPQIVALRNLLIQSATEVRDVMRKAASGNEADLMAYAEAKQRHLMIQERVHSVTAEAGRALRAFQGQFTGMKDAKAIGEFLKKETGQTLFQLEREVQLGMSLETPSQVSKFINDSKKATFSQMAMEYWINSILSGTLTQVVSLVGNTTAIALSLAETAGTAGVGKIRAVMGNKGERVHIGEAKAGFFGIVQGAQDGIRAAKHVFKNEEQYNRARTVEQSKYQAIPSKRIVLKNYEQGSPEYNSRIENIANARARAERLTGRKFDARVDELKANPSSDMVVEAKERAVEIGGKQIRIPGRLLTAQDELYKTIAYRQKLNELAFREATEKGLSGNAFDEHIARLTMDPTEEMMKVASAFADYQTFTNALGKTGSSIAAFANSHVAAKGIVPFVRSPVNTLKYANERSLLGLFSKEVRGNLSGANGKIAQDTQIARLAIGSAIAITAMYYASEDIITGYGPSNQNERAALMLSGWRPYSVKIGDFYYSYARLEPISTIIGIAGDIGDAINNGLDPNGDEMSKVAANFLAAISKSVLNKASMQGVSDFINAVTEPERYGARFFQNRVSSFIPTFSAQRAREFDEHNREIRSTLDAVRSRIPGLRDSLLPKRDIWGEPIKSDDRLGPDAFSLVPMSKLTNDPATKALLDAELFPARIGRKIRGVELTDQQYDELARVAGRMAKMRVNAIVSNPGFENAPVEIRSTILKKAIDGSREAARSMIMMKNPDIIKTAVENKMATVGR